MNFFIYFAHESLLIVKNHLSCSSLGICVAFEISQWGNQRININVKTEKKKLFSITTTITSSKYLKRYYAFKHPTMQLIQVYLMPLLRMFSKMIKKVSSSHKYSRNCFVLYLTCCNHCYSLRFFRQGCRRRFTDCSIIHFDVSDVFQLCKYFQGWRNILKSNGQGWLYTLNYSKKLYNSLHSLTMFK